MGCLHRVYPVPGFYALYQGSLSVILRSVYCIHTRLVQGHRINGCENTDVPHLRVMGMGVAVAVQMCIRDR